MYVHILFPPPSHPHPPPHTHTPRTTHQGLPVIRLGGVWHCGVGAIDFAGAVRDAGRQAGVHPRSVLLLDNLDAVFPGEDEEGQGGGRGALGVAPDGASLLLLCELLRSPPEGCFALGIAPSPDSLLQVGGWALGAAGGDKGALLCRHVTSTHAGHHPPSTHTHTRTQIHMQYTGNSSCNWCAFEPTAAPRASSTPNGATLHINQQLPLCACVRL